MATLLKNNSAIGAYITEDFGGKIVANTPGDLDLDNLTLYTDYIYLANFLRLEFKGTANYDSVEWYGHKTISYGNGRATHHTGTAERMFWMLTAEDTEANAVGMKKLWKLDNRTIAGWHLYLIIQRASETFLENPLPAGTLKKYIPVIIRGVNTVEIADSGKDVQLITVGLEEVHTS